MRATREVAGRVALTQSTLFIAAFAGKDEAAGVRVRPLCTIGDDEAFVHSDSHVEEQDYNLHAEAEAVEDAAVEVPRFRFGCVVWCQ